MFPEVVVSILPDFLVALQDNISFSEYFSIMHFYIISHRDTHTQKKPQPKTKMKTKQTATHKANQPDKKT